jgi:hypothetical protein
MILYIIRDDYFGLFLAGADNCFTCYIVVYVFKKTG